jgi:hypothetical protein
MKADPSAETLAIARLFLQHSGVYGTAHDEADRKRLKGMHRLYLQRLYEAVTSDEKPPSASIFAEVRRALTANGIAKDGAAIEPLEALERLQFDDLPFKTSQ